MKKWYPSSLTNEEFGELVARLEILNLGQVSVRDNRKIDALLSKLFTLSGKEKYFEKKEGLS